MVLITKARALYGTEKIPDLDLDDVIYALDSSTIDLCLHLFPWAKFRRAKAAIKLHTLYDIRCQVPAFIHVSDGKLHDVNILDILVIEIGAFYIMDRGYVDFRRLFRIHQERAFFVTRAKDNLDYRRIESRPVDKTTGLRADQTVHLVGVRTRTLYPEPLRRISYRDPETKLRLTFLTNNFSLPANIIAILYKKRWQVELFFKWIKQNLRIRHFFGTSDNAVKTQIWIAVSAYVLVMIARKALRTELSPAKLLQIVSVTPFDKTPLLQLVTAQRAETQNSESSNQLLLNL
jgi:IS4 transposase